MTSAARPSRKRLGDLLVDAGVITAAQLASALDLQTKLKIPLGRVLVDKRAITEAGLVQFLAQQLGLQVAVVPDHPPSALSLIALDDAERMRVFPLGLRKEAKGDVLLLAMADPTNIDSIDHIQFKTSVRVLPLIIGESALESAIRRHYYGEHRREVAAQSPVQFAGTEVDLPSNPGGAPILVGESSAPVVRGIDVDSAGDDDIPVLTGVQLNPTPLAMRSPFAAPTAQQAPSARDLPSTSPLASMFGPSDAFIGGDDEQPALGMLAAQSAGPQRGGAASSLGSNVGVNASEPASPAEMPILDLGDANVLDPRSDSRVAHVDPALWPPLPVAPASAAPASATPWSATASAPIATDPLTGEALDFVLVPVDAAPVSSFAQTGGGFAQNAHGSFAPPASAPAPALSQLSSAAVATDPLTGEALDFTLEAVGAQLHNELDARAVESVGNDNTAAPQTNDAIGEQAIARAAVEQAAIAQAAAAQAAAALEQAAAEQAALEQAAVARRAAEQAALAQAALAQAAREGAAAEQAARAQAAVEQAAAEQAALAQAALAQAALERAAAEQAARAQAAVEQAALAQAALEGAAAERAALAQAALEQAAAEQPALAPAAAAAAAPRVDVASRSWADDVDDARALAIPSAPARADSIDVVHRLDPALTVDAAHDAVAGAPFASISDEATNDVVEANVTTDVAIDVVNAGVANHVVHVVHVVADELTELTDANALVEVTDVELAHDAIADAIADASAPLDAAENKGKNASGVPSGALDEPLSLVDEMLEAPARVTLDATSAAWADAVDNSVIVRPVAPHPPTLPPISTSTSTSTSASSIAPRPLTPLTPRPLTPLTPLAREGAGFDADAVDALVRAAREGPALTLNVPPTVGELSSVGEDVATTLPSRPQFSSLTSSLPFTETPSPSLEAIPAFLTPGPMPSTASMVAAGRVTLISGGVGEPAQVAPNQSFGSEAAGAATVAPMPANVASSGPMAKLDDAKLASLPFCPDCGANRLSDAKFCPHCGCSFTGVQRAKGALPATPPKTRPMMPAVNPAAAIVSAALAKMGKPGEALDVELLEGIKNNVVHLRPRTAPGANVDEPAVLVAKPAASLPVDAAAIGLGVTMGAVPVVSDASTPDEVAVIAGGKRPVAPVAPAHLHLVSDVATHAMARVDDAVNLGPSTKKSTAPAPPAAAAAPSSVLAPPRGAPSGAPSGGVDIAAMEGQWSARLTSQAGLVDDEGALTAGTPAKAAPFTLGLGVTHQGDVLMDAALVDDPAVLVGGKAASTHITRAVRDHRTSTAFAKVDDASELGPLRQGSASNGSGNNGSGAQAKKTGSLAADWQDAAEKQIPRKDDRTNVESVPRAREVFFAPDASAVPPPPAPEPIVEYRPAPPAAPAGPAPWARFAGAAQPPTPAAGVPPPAPEPKKPGAATMMMSLDAVELRALAERLAEKGALSPDEINAAKKK